MSDRLTYCLRPRGLEARRCQECAACHLEASRNRIAWHEATVTRLRTALERIAEYDTDWTQGPSANVNALQAIAEAALHPTDNSAPAAAPPPPTCANWCGTFDAVHAAADQTKHWHPGDGKCYDSWECMKAGRPLNPAPDDNPACGYEGHRLCPTCPTDAPSGQAESPAPSPEKGTGRITLMTNEQSQALDEAIAEVDRNPINLAPTYPSAGVSGTTRDARPLNPPCPTCGGFGATWKRDGCTPPCDRRATCPTCSPTPEPR